MVPPLLASSTPKVITHCSAGNTGVCYRMLTTFEIAARQADQGLTRA
jgi:hypothetical protein